MSAEGAIAARQPDGDILVAYDSPEGVVVTLRTPLWWGDASYRLSLD